MALPSSTTRTHHLDLSHFIQSPGLASEQTPTSALASSSLLSTGQPRYFNMKVQPWPCYLKCFCGWDITQIKSCTPDGSTRPLISLNSSPSPAPTPATLAPCGLGSRPGAFQSWGLARCPHALPSDSPLPDALISVKSLLDSHLNETSSAHLIQISTHPTTFLFPLPSLPSYLFCFPVLIRFIVYCVSASLKHKL